MPSDEELITLIKNAAKENQFDKISTEEMEHICHLGLSLSKRRSYDDDLLKAIDRFKTEIEYRKKKSSLKLSHRQSENAIIMDSTQRPSYEIMKYDKAIEQNPKDADAYFNRGLAYAALCDYQKVIADFHKVIELDPRDATAYYNLGSAFSKLGDNKQAIENVKKSAGLGFIVAQNLLKKKGITW